MMSFKLPSMFIFGDRPGLLVGDDEVMLVNWRGGVLRQIAVYDNDENGIALFAEHFSSLSKHRYRNMGFFVVANVVGEDYRHEKVAHLTGKNKIDFHESSGREYCRKESKAPCHLFNNRVQTAVYCPVRRARFSTRVPGAI